MFDSYNREIDYLRISVTDRCNLRCTYCMPEAGIALKSHSDILPYEKIVQVAAAAAELGIRKIRLTGGEPLVRKNIAFLVRELKAVPGVREVSMTSNGTLLDLLAAELKQAGLDRLNISLDTLDAGPLPAGHAQRRHRPGHGRDRRRPGGRLRRHQDQHGADPGFNDDEVEAMKEFCRRRTGCGCSASTITACTT